MPIENDRRWNRLGMAFELHFEAIDRGVFGSRISSNRFHRTDKSFHRGILWPVKATSSSPAPMPTQIRLLGQHCVLMRAFESETEFVNQGPPMSHERHSADLSITNSLSSIGWNPSSVPMQSFVRPTQPVQASGSSQASSDRQDEERRNTSAVERIRSMINSNAQLRAHASDVQVAVENRSIVLRGRLPSNDLKRQLLPTVRQAGVMGRVENRVQVDA